MIGAKVFLSTCRQNGVKAILKVEPNTSIFVRCFRSRVRKIEVKETVKQAGSKMPSSFAVGEMALAGGGVFGLGALCYYGLGLSNEIGTVERSMLWSDEVRKRINSTFKYFGASMVAVAGSAVAFYKSPYNAKFVELCSRRPILSTVGIIAALIGSSTAMNSIPYEPGLNAKHAMWLANAGIIGAVLAPVGFLGGPLVMKAGMITGGIVGGLSMVAMCAPSDKFLSWGAPLGMGLGGVFVATIASNFIPITSRAFGPVYSIAVYGGVLVFSGLLLYDTQKIVRTAETHPLYAYNKYDPINQSHRVVMDVINIFIRIVQILALGGGNRRK